MRKERDYPMNQPDPKEMLALTASAHAWIDNLIISGVTEQSAVVSILQALTERAMMVKGPAATAQWLHAYADFVSDSGGALLKSLKEQKGLKG